jgi:hypothetical protein
VTGWLMAILTGLGVLVLGMVKADLEDAKVCRWLARQLIYRAAEHLPHEERARWREESIRDALDLPGRLPPLLWALDVYLKAGSWGRMRGGPSWSQVLVARVRAAWRRLRSLSTEWARERSKQRHPSYSRPLVEATEVVATATVEATVTARGVTQSGGSATLGYSPKTAFDRHRKSLPHLSDEEVVTLLSQSTHEFFADVDRRIEEYRRRRYEELGL